MFFYLYIAIRPYIRVVSPTGLFVDVGNNYSVLEYNNISFVYDDIDARDPLANTDFSGELVRKLIKFVCFPVQDKIYVPCFGPRLWL